MVEVWGALQIFTMSLIVYPASVPGIAGVFCLFWGDFKQYMEYLEPWILSDVLAGETGQPSSLGGLGRKAR